MSEDSAIMFYNFYNLKFKYAIKHLVLGKTEESKDKIKKDDAIAAVPSDVRTDERTQGISEDKIAAGETSKEKEKAKEERGAARGTPAAAVAVAVVEPVTVAPRIPKPATETTLTAPVATIITPTPTPTTAPVAVVGDTVTLSNPIKAQGASMESAPKVPSTESTPKVPSMGSTPEVPVTVEGEKVENKKEEGKKIEVKKVEGKKVEWKKEEMKKVEGEKGLKVGVEHGSSEGRSSDSEALHTPSFIPMIVCSTLVLFLSIMCAFWLR